MVVEIYWWQQKFIVFVPLELKGFVLPSLDIETFLNMFINEDVTDLLIEEKIRLSKVPVSLVFGALADHLGELHPLTGTLSCDEVQALLTTPDALVAWGLFKTACMHRKIELSDITFSFFQQPPADFKLN